MQSLCRVWGVRQRPSSERARSNGEGSQRVAARHRRGERLQPVARRSLPAVVGWVIVGLILARLRKNTQLP